MAWQIADQKTIRFVDPSSFDIYGQASATLPSMHGLACVIDLNPPPPVKLFSGRVVPAQETEVQLVRHSTGQVITKTMSDAAGLFSFDIHVLLENSDDLEILVNTGPDFETKSFELIPIDAYPTP